MFTTFARVPKPTKPKRSNYTRPQLLPTTFDAQHVFSGTRPDGDVNRDRVWLILTVTRFVNCDKIYGEFIVISDRAVGQRQITDAIK